MPAQQLSVPGSAYFLLDVIYMPLYLLLCQVCQVKNITQFMTNIFHESDPEVGQNQPETV
jgi:hypothetical protein